MRPARLLIVLLALAVLVAGCSSSSGGGDAASASDTLGEKPTITVPDADPPTELVVDTVVTGEGPEVETGNLLVVDYVGVLWDDGTEFDSSWSSEQPATFPIGTGGVIKGWDDGLVGQTVGSRVLLTVPPDLGYGDEPQGDTIPAGSTLVFAVDILDAFSAADDVGGTPVTDLPTGLPTVTGDPGSQPEIALDGATAPKQARATVLIEGSGDPLADGAPVVVEAYGVSYETGEPVLSTWEGSPEAISPDALPGLADAVAGQNAGTRLLLQLPAAQGSGGQAVALVLDLLGSVQRNPS